MTPGPSIATAPAQPPSADTFPVWMQVLLATACGLLIANLYYAQPVLDLVATAVGLPRHSAGLIVTLPLLGYGIGLLMVVPLGDLMENRTLVLTLVAAEAVCMALASLLSTPVAFLGVAFFIGLTAAAVQLLVPYVTYLAPETIRGRAIGEVVSGVMFGIMLARPVSSFITDLWSWRTMFQISAVLMAALFAALWAALPARRPPPGLTYRQLLLSLGHIFATTEVLRRRALYHATMFGAFSVFWTTAPLWLSSPQFGLTQREIAWVALAGVAGALAPPLAGRLADRNLSQPGTLAAMLLASLAFLLSDLARDGTHRSLALVIAAAVILDFAVSANLVFGQRAIYSLSADQRSRINGLYLATFFAGGAISSALAGWCYFAFGWTGVSVLGAALPLLGLVYFATEYQPRRVATRS